MYTFNVVSTLAWPISCATTFPGTPRWCDHEEYVRRNVSHVAGGPPGYQLKGGIRQWNLPHSRFGFRRVELAIVDHLVHRNESVPFIDIPPPRRMFLQVTGLTAVRRIALSTRTRRRPARHSACW